MPHDNWKQRAIDCRASLKAIGVLTQLETHYQIPLINNAEEGSNSVVCEWWNKDRKLTLYIDQEPMAAVETSDVDIGNGHGEYCCCDECMPVVYLQTVDTFVQDFAPLWNWLQYKL